MAIPVILCDLFIRFIWAIKKHFYAKEAWKNCIPLNKHDDLRVMIIVGTGSLCAVDGIDASIRGIVEGGFTPAAIVPMILHMNLVAWSKLAMMSVRELVIRYNYLLDDLYKPFAIIQQAIEEYLAELETIDIELYQKEVKAYVQFNRRISKAQSEEELNKVLMITMKELDIDLPWEGDFDEFMSNKNNRLVFE